MIDVYNSKNRHTTMLFTRRRLTSIYRALTDQGINVFPYQAKRKVDYFCPHCQQVVRLKAGKMVAHHFYHLTKCSCDYSSESIDHINMKNDVIHFLKDYPFGTEVSVIPDRRADVVIYQENQPYVIECQASPITIREWQKRTLDYSKHGVFVVWIFHSKRLKFNPRAQLLAYLEEEMRVPAEILYSLDNTQGLSIIYHPGFKKKFVALKTYPVKRVDVINGRITRHVLKTVKKLQFLPVQPKIQSFTGVNLLASFRPQKIDFSEVWKTLT